MANGSHQRLRSLHGQLRGRTPIALILTNTTIIMNCTTSEADDKDDAKKAEDVRHSSSTIQLLQLAGQSHHGEVMPVIGDLYLKKDIKRIQARL